MNTPRFQARRGPGYGDVPFQAVYHPRPGASFQPRGTFGALGKEPMALPLLGTGAGALAITAWKGFMAYQILAPISRNKMPPKWALWWVGTWYLINGVYFGLAGLGLTAAGAAGLTAEK